MTEADSDADSLALTCNQKERTFAEEYVIDLNGTQAVLRSGCFNVNSNEAAAVTSSRLLSRDKVKALVEILRAQRSARTAMTADSVLHEMSLLSHSSVSHYVVDDEGNVQLTPGAPEGAMRAIQSIKRKKTVKEDKEGNITITYDVELKLWDKPTPLKLMGKNVGLFPDKMELTGRDGQPLEVVTKIERVVIASPKV